MQCYENSLRTIERRVTCFFVCGLLCVVTSGILITTRSATSQQVEQQSQKAPFRVVGSNGQTIFEVKDSPYGGRMSLFAKGGTPILEAFSTEKSTLLIIRETTKSGKTIIGANFERGVIEIQDRNGRSIFHKPF